MPRPRKEKKEEKMVQVKIPVTSYPWKYRPRSIHGSLTLRQAEALARVWAVLWEEHQNGRPPGAIRAVGVILDRLADTLGLPESDAEVEKMIRQMNQ